jgi:hypothetical protein
MKGNEKMTGKKAKRKKRERHKMQVTETDKQMDASLLPAMPCHAPGTITMTNKKKQKQRQDYDKGRKEKKTHTPTLN